eukprot:8031458-Lingulodinium_polyedra.AAC.1
MPPLYQVRPRAPAARAVSDMRPDMPAPLLAQRTRLPHLQRREDRGDARGHAAHTACRPRDRGALRTGPSTKRGPRAWGRHGGRTPANR